MGLWHRLVVFSENEWEISRPRSTRHLESPIWREKQKGKIKWQEQPTRFKLTFVLNELYWIEQTNRLAANQVSDASLIFVEYLSKETNRLDLSIAPDVIYRRVQGE